MLGPGVVLALGLSLALGRVAFWAGYHAAPPQGWRGPDQSGILAPDRTGGPGHDSHLPIGFAMTGVVTGIGGIFFRAADPEALAAWYGEHLGVTSFGPWPQEAGIAVFAPFKADTDYWPGDRQWMLNLRVQGLDALIARLQAAGISVETRPDEWDDPAIGRFARIADPEGNPIELWEPPAES